MAKCWYIDRDLKQVFTGYMGVQKNISYTGTRGRRSSDTQTTASFVRVGDILKNPRYLYEMKERFARYEWAKEPK